MTVAINIIVGKEFPSAHLFQYVPPKYKINIINNKMKENLTKLLGL
jgi:hypothetical protein